MCLYDFKNDVNTLQPNGEEVKERKFQCLGIKVNATTVQKSQTFSKSKNVKFGVQDFESEAIVVDEKY